MLNWRDRPANNELISKIHEKLLEIDHLRKTVIELCETTNTGALAIEDYEGETMWTRRACGTSRNAETHIAQLSKFVAVGIEVGHQYLS